MATLKNFPNNADEYIGAENVMKWLHGRSSGVFGADGNLSVTPGDGLSVDVSDGVSWMANNESDGTVVWNDTEATTGSKVNLTFALSDPAMTRIDRVVQSWDTVDYTAKPTLEVLQGTPGSQPQPPALTNTTLKRQISLAQVKIKSGASQIAADDITDERLDPAVCGIVTASVGVDTTVMDAQFKALLAIIQGLLEDLQAGTAAMLKAVYDPREFARDVFADIGYQYTALYNLDGWEDSGNPDYPYTQTVTLTPEIEGAPTVTESSKFYAEIGTPKTGVAETDDALKKALNVIADGVTTTGAGTVTTLVREKPASDIPVVWTLRTEV